MRRGGRRILAIHFPYLAAEARLRREGASGLAEPFAIVGTQKNALCIISTNIAAEAAGLSQGMGLADARAVCPTLHTRPVQPERHRMLLSTLVRWAERFSPMVGTDRSDTLVLDISGCAHLFGGETMFCTSAVEQCAALNLTARTGLADTRGGAWALAHAAPGIAPASQTRHTLADLPVWALRIDTDTVEALGAIGLTTIGALARIPRGQLARRFGLATLKRLDQALGAEPEPVSPERARQQFIARLSLPEPVGLTKDVMAALEQLLERVCSALTREHQGARRLSLVATRVDGLDTSAEIRLARPGRDPIRLRALFERKVSEMDAGYGIDSLRLAALETEPLKPAQTGRETQSDRLSDLLSRLGNRIGFEHVTRFLPNESHIPERAFTVAAAAWSEPEAFSTTLLRPLTLFNPEPLPGAGTHALPHDIAWRGQRLTL
ncbi:MAG: DNA polymerase Y family protein, partial [Pseudomonadota bacterium]